MIRPFLLLTFLTLCSVGARAVTLADFSFKTHREFAARAGRGADELCAARLTPVRTMTAAELKALTGQVAHARAMVFAWRRAARGEDYFTERETDLMAAFDRLIWFRGEFDLSRALAGAVDRMINELRFLSMYRGFVAAESEREALLTQLLARSARLKNEHRYLAEDVDRFTFELSVLRGQEAMAVFKGQSGGRPTFDADRARRGDRLDVLERNARKFARRVESLK